MLVLGIESSCDETGIAIYDSAKGLIANELYTQIPLHTQFGGVVPELASREHICKILPLLNETMNNGGRSLFDLDLIAYTAGPGLVGSLMVGAAFAAALGCSVAVPTIPVHHLEAHLLAPMLDDATLDFPFLALLVSGGHTQLLEAQGLGKYKLLGETLDDAVGEAFDKVAKILGLGYPGGPQLAKVAEQGDRQRFKFPRPMADRDDLDFSFSGLKTFTLQFYRKQLDVKANQELNLVADIAAAFQEAAVDALLIKCRKALQQLGSPRLVVAGGVSANRRLRERLQELQGELGVALYFPRAEFCTDNGAMIAYTGYRRYVDGGVNCESTLGSSAASEVMVYPRWTL